MMFVFCHQLIYNSQYSGPAWVMNKKWILFLRSIERTGIVLCFPQANQIMVAGNFVLYILRS